MQRPILGALLLAAPAWVLASGLQISPTSLALAASQNADGIWLSNTGDSVISAQARVFLWTQQNSDDRLSPSAGLIISPPMLQIPPGGKQFVRVIRSGPPPAAQTETAYRVIVDELPLESPLDTTITQPAPSKPKLGLSFVMRYSMPVFVQGPGIPAFTGQALKWHLHKDANQWTVEAQNTGLTHVRIADLQATLADGSRASVRDGLMGYVLAGQTMRWKLPPPAISQPVTSYQALLNLTDLPIQVVESSQP